MVIDRTIRKSDGSFL